MHFELSQECTSNLSNIINLTFRNYPNKPLSSLYYKTLCKKYHDCTLKNGTKNVTEILIRGQRKDDDTAWNEIKWWHDLLNSVCVWKRGSERESKRVCTNVCVLPPPLTCATQVMRLQAEGQMKDGQARWQVYFWSSEAAPSMKNDVPGLNN